MWCTRWYLPLVLLPFPIAPPYFLLLFLFSTTVHARPCFYCMVLLTTMFMSTCYWPPAPIETPLMRPWSDNVTTYADALRLMLPNLPGDKVPATIPIADRCWCDLSHGFFEPFNTTKWEELSVTRVKESLEREIAAEERAREKERCEAAGGEQNEGSGTCEIPEDEPVVPDPTPSPSLSFPESLIWRVAQRLRARGKNTGGTPSSASLAGEPKPTREPSPPGSQSESKPAPTHAPNVTITPEQSSVRMPWSRREYDLRKFGFAMVLDFSWPSYSALPSIQLLILNKEPAIEAGLYWFAILARDSGTCTKSAESLRVRDMDVGREEEVGGPTKMPGRPSIGAPFRLR